jgi:hypothetical protein
MRRKNRSSQRDAGAVGEGLGVVGLGEDVDAGVACESVGHGDALEGDVEAGGDAAAGDDGGQDGAQEPFGLVDQAGEVLAGGVPFEHGEFAGVKRAPLPVPPDAGELEDRAGAGGEQAFHREFGTGVQPERAGGAVGLLDRGAECAEMDLLAGCRHGVRGFDLVVAAGLEPGTDGAGKAHAATDGGMAGGEALALGVCRGHRRLLHRADADH